MNISFHCSPNLTSLHIHPNDTFTQGLVLAVVEDFNQPGTETPCFAVTKQIGYNMPEILGQYLRRELAMAHLKDVLFDERIELPSYITHACYLLAH